MSKKLILLNATEAMTLHKEMWGNMALMAKNGEFPDKVKVLNEMGYDAESVCSNCILCEYANTVYKQHYGGLMGQHSKCEFCPGNFTKHDVSVPCFAIDSSYTKFQDYRIASHSTIRKGDDKLIVEICQAVADIGMREGIE